MHLSNCFKLAFKIRTAEKSKALFPMEPVEEGGVLPRGTQTLHGQKSLLSLYPLDTGRQ
jgi:hypothetical protein